MKNLTKGDRKSQGNRIGNGYTYMKIEYKFDGNLNKLHLKVFVKMFRYKLKYYRRFKRKCKRNIRQSSFGMVFQQRVGNKIF